MVRTRFRALFVLATLLLIAPVVAAIGLDAGLRSNWYADRGGRDNHRSVVRGDAANVAAYVATEFDPASDQYLELSALAAKLDHSRCRRHDFCHRRAAGETTRGDPERSAIGVAG